MQPPTDSHGPHPAATQSQPHVNQDPTFPETPNISTPQPNDAKTMEAILHSMGVDDYDPRVTHQLLELLYRYVSTVLSEARIYSEHADKPTIDAEDIKLAVTTRANSSFCQPPPRDITSQLAAERNSIPLPPIENRAGIALPRSAYQLTRQNYRLNKPIQGAHSTPYTRVFSQPPTDIDPDVVIVDNPAPTPPNKRPKPIPSTTPMSSALNTPQPMEIVDIDSLPPSSLSVPQRPATTSAPASLGLSSQPRPSVSAPNHNSLPFQGGMPPPPPPSL